MASRNGSQAPADLAGLADSPACAGIIGVSSAAKPVGAAPPFRIGRGGFGRHVGRMTPNGLPTDAEHFSDLTLSLHLWM